MYGAPPLYGLHCWISLGCQDGDALKWYHRALKWYHRNDQTVYQTHDNTYKEKRIIMCVK